VFDRGAEATFRLALRTVELLMWGRVTSKWLKLFGEKLV
jgi:hypothetical protein